MNTPTNIFARTRFALAGAVLVIGSLACSLAGSESPTPTFSVGLLETVVAQTLQAATPLASPTAQATGTTTPTSAGAQPTSASPATRIRFESGATATNIQGSLGANETQTFVLGAMKDQPMIVLLDSPRQDLGLAIFGQDGSHLLDAASGQTNWQGNHLPSTQDYYVRVIGSASAEDFTLTLVVPSRIAFTAGSDTATLNGTTAGGHIVSYGLYASAGQKMTVNLTAPGDSAALTIYGFSDGQPYLRSVAESKIFEMRLPATQDYIIQVVPQAGQLVAYTLTVKVR